MVLVELNCSALPEIPAESELFGHERGLYGCSLHVWGYLRQPREALFLDEIPGLS